MRESVTERAEEGDSVRACRALYYFNGGSGKFKTFQIVQFECGLKIMLAAAVPRMRVCFDVDCGVCPSAISHNECECAVNFYNAHIYTAIGVKVAEYMWAVSVRQRMMVNVWKFLLFAQFIVM